MALTVYDLLEKSFLICIDQPIAFRLSAPLYATAMEQEE